MALSCELGAANATLAVGSSKIALLVLRFWHLNSTGKQAARIASNTKDKLESTPQSPSTACSPFSFLFVCAESPKIYFCARARTSTDSLRNSLKLLLFQIP